MATLAQYLYSISYSDKPQDEETEHFKEFRDNLLKMPDMSVEKLDSEISIESKVSRHKEVVTTPGTVYRRSHSLIRKKLKEGTKLSNIGLILFWVFLLRYLLYQRKVKLCKTIWEPTMKNQK